MFNIFNQDSQGVKIIFKIDGMHCTSCSLNIDGELEDADGVFSAKTSYAKAKTEISYDPKKISPQKLKEVIESLNYSVTEIKQE